MKSSLITLFDRHLNNLHKEISAYEKEANLWLIDGEILNSGGNLCLHLVGNLNHFIGFGLGNTGYQRDRPGEFNDKNIPREKMLGQIRDTQKMIKEVLENMDDSVLDKPYPDLFNWLKDGESAGFALMHLLAHLTYHMGQINYHRRLLDV